MSGVSANETEAASLTAEDFWFIVAFKGSEDETEIREKRPAEAVIKDIRRATRAESPAIP